MKRKICDYWGISVRLHEHYIYMYIYLYIVYSKCYGAYFCFLLLLSIELKIFDNLLYRHLRLYSFICFYHYCPIVRFE